MSADVLREAARWIRTNIGCSDIDRHNEPFLEAVADLLDNAANRAGAAFGPKSDDTDADALKVARAYLGESA